MLHTVSLIMEIAKDLVSYIQYVFNSQASTDLDVNLKVYPMIVSRLSKSAYSVCFVCNNINHEINTIVERAFFQQHMYNIEIGSIVKIYSVCLSTDYNILLHHIARLDQESILVYTTSKMIVAVNACGAETILYSF